ncbi:MAG: hypothetical protein ACLFQB_15350, partial [Chitinispirillaceae bacterium]
MQKKQSMPYMIMKRFMGNMNSRIGMLTTKVMKHIQTVLIRNKKSTKTTMIMQNTHSMNTTGMKPLKT